MAKKDENKIVMNYPYFMPKGFKALLAWLINFAPAFKSLEGKYDITKPMTDQVTAIVAAIKVAIEATIDLTALLKQWNEARNLMVGTEPDPDGVPVNYGGNWSAGELPAVVESGAINFIIEMAKRLDVRNDLTDQDRTALRLVKPAPQTSNRKETAEKLEYPFNELLQVGDDAVVRTTRGNKYAGLMMETRVDMKGDGIFVFYDKNTDKDTVIKMDFKPGEVVKSVSVTCVYLKGGQEVSKWTPIESISIQKRGPAGPAPAAAPAEEPAAE